MKIFNLKKSLFIVESPLQLMCAYEAINKFKLKKVEIILRLASNGNTNNQLLQLKKILLNNYKIKEVYIKPQSRNIIDILYSLYLTFYVSIKFYLGYFIFIGFFESKFASLLTKFVKQKSKCFLDDGVASLMYSDDLLNSSSCIFSIFDFNSPFFIKNRLENITNFVLSSKKERIESVIFIGSPIRETEISFDKYIEILSAIVSKYKNNEMLYFPHRREKDADLKVIKEIGLKVLTNQLPIEMFGYEYPTYYPKVIVSTFSTAIFTMRNIYNSDIIAYDIRDSGIKNSKAFNQIYHEIKKIGEIVKI